MTGASGLLRERATTLDRPPIATVFFRGSDVTNCFDQLCAVRAIDDFLDRFVPVSAHPDLPPDEGQFGDHGNADKCICSSTLLNSQRVAIAEPRQTGNVCARSAQQPRTREKQLRRELHATGA